MAALRNSINFTVDCKIDKLEVRKGKKCKFHFVNNRLWYLLTWVNCKVVTWKNGFTPTLSTWNGIKRNAR